MKAKDFANCSIVALSLFASSLVASSRADESNKDLWQAAKTGDAQTVDALLKKGVDVNAKTEKYGATALSFAADKGHLAVVKVLLRHKAAVNVRDRFYKATPLTWAVSKNHPEIVRALLKAGATGADGQLASAVRDGKLKMVQALLDEGKIKPSMLNSALLLTTKKQRKISELLKKAGAKLPKQFSVKREVLQSYAGKYSGESVEITIVLEAKYLAIKLGNRRVGLLLAESEEKFKSAGSTSTITFLKKGEKVTGLKMKSGTNETTFVRGAPKRADPPKIVKVPTQPPAKVARPKNWPSFRGLYASGVADGQAPPLQWNAKKEHNIVWKTKIPGLGLSCPVVWGNRVFITTAVSGDPKSKLKSGLYGNVESVNDTSVHTWHVYCLDKNNGKVLWNRIAHRGVPMIKRHPKSSHANSTVATDGKHIAALFGAEGLYCYDENAKLLWKNDLGIRDSGWFYDSAYQWGFGSSPIIYRNMVIVQCDTGKKSFIAAYDLADGGEVWRTPRDEIPSWGTPTMFKGKNGDELVTNGTKYARGYDPLTGKDLWRLGPNSEITVPTPFWKDDLIYVVSGYRPPRPVWAVRAGARGDISPKKGKKKGKSIAWSNNRAGTYMPTPIVYGDHLYTCSTRGRLTCLHAKTGKQIYRKNLTGTAYTASPIAADGRLYFTSEEGISDVVKAGGEFALLAVNDIGDTCLATPAISDGMIFIRSERYLFGVGRKQ